MLARLNHPAARVHDAYRPLSPKGDPTGTKDVRRRYKAETDLRWRRMAKQLREVIVQQDMLGLDTSKPTSLGLALQAMPSHQLVVAFQTWVDKTLERTTLEHDAAYLDSMISISFNRAVKRAMRLTKSKTQPADAADAVGALQQAVVVEMQGINEAVSQRIVRAASDAILNRRSPKQLLTECAMAIEQVGVTRSRAMVEAYVSKAFSVGTLDQFEAAGIKRVGLIPETVRGKQTKDGFLADAPTTARRGGPAGTGPGSRGSREEPPSTRTIARIRKAQAQVESLGEVDIVTAGDDLVCPDCEDLESGGPYSIDEARSLIPAHPWCRCAFVPTGAE